LREGGRCGPRIFAGEFDFRRADSPEKFREEKARRRPPRRLNSAGRDATQRPALMILTGMTRASPRTKPGRRQGWIVVGRRSPSDPKGSDLALARGPRRPGGLTQAGPQSFLDAGRGPCLPRSSVAFGVKVAATARRVVKGKLDARSGDGRAGPKNGVPTLTDCAPQPPEKRQVLN
jgi:hypothetical protein